MLDLVTFLKTAEIGDLKAGMSYEEYCSKFGEIPKKDQYPIDSNDPDYGFHYFNAEGIELTFIEKVLYTISLDPARLVFELLDETRITANTTLENILEYLSLLQIDWEFMPKYTFKQQAIIQTNTGVQISFNYTKGYGMLLSRIQYYGDL
jgi:hypothetical protein